MQTYLNNIKYSTQGHNEFVIITCEYEINYNKF